MGNLKTKAEQGAPGTKERILEAAMVEFSEKGYAGARVDTIAKAANVNIRMIYYFFGSKKQLLTDVIVARSHQHRRELLDLEIKDLDEYLASYFSLFANVPESIRLVQWEALELKEITEEEITNFKGRELMLQEHVKVLEKLQKQAPGLAKVDSKLLQILIMAVASYPFTFPQIVYLITGEMADSKSFQKRYMDFLRTVLDKLASND